MTKLIEIGKSQNNQTKVPIVFDHYLANLDFGGKQFAKTKETPSDYKYIELICRNYIADVDLMFAYMDESQRSDGYLYVGRWNDGVIG